MKWNPVKVTYADGTTKKFHSSEQFAASVKDPTSRAAMYPDYVRSKQWRMRRTLHIMCFPNCVACGKRAELVHHASYESLGRERIKHLLSVCKSCHLAIHNEARYANTDDALYAASWRAINKIREKRKVRARSRPAA